MTLAGSREAGMLKFLTQRVPLECRSELPVQTEGCIEGSPSLRRGKAAAEWRVVVGLARRNYRDVGGPSSTIQVSPCSELHRGHSLSP